MPVGVGLVGAGNISTQYLTHLATYPDVRVIALGDLDEARAAGQAKAFGVPASGGPDAVLDHPDVDLVVNLTIPAAHVEISTRAVRAGKHVWGGEPLGPDRARRPAAETTAMGPGELTRPAEVIAVGLTEMRGTTAPRLHLELMCARVLLPGADVDGRGVHARLDRLERRLSVGAPANDAPASPTGPTSRAVPVASAPDPGTESARNAPASQGAGRSVPDPVTEAPAGALAVEPADVLAREAPPWEEPPTEPAPAKQPAESEPAPSRRSPQREEPAASTPVAPPAASTPEAPPAGAAARSGLGTADVRRFWPQILENVKNRRRFTWILLSQNSQVVDVRDGVLTLGLSNAGARDSFGRGGSPDVLREAILEVLGAALHINPIVDAAAEPTPPGNLTQPPSSPASPPRSPAAEQARANLRPTRSQASPAEAETEVEPSRDDAVVAEDSASADELIMKHLGAELIGEDDD